MKTILYSIIIGFLLYARLSSAQEVNLKINNSSLIEVLEQVELQTDIHFIYRSEELISKDTITVNVLEYSLFELLDEILPELNLEYEVFEKYIAIKAAKTSPTTNYITKRKKITGTVKREKGYPIPGATIFVKGQSIGTISDINGFFSIDLPNPVTKLYVSFIGMVPQV
ncbi:MAG: carboxypeptidase-like regulatory domain-containing protein, partial [Carboxylicivirga sp.]|nr:carboxypeptidase-like regulatory domain-containing protein [Carboxylicivirga sp.]